MEAAESCGGYRWWHLERGESVGWRRSAVGVVRRSRRLPLFGCDCAPRWTQLLGRPHELRPIDVPRAPIGQPTSASSTRWLATPAASARLSPAQGRHVGSGGPPVPPVRGRPPAPRDECGGGARQRDRRGTRYRRGLGRGRRRPRLAPRRRSCRVPGRRRISAGAMPAPARPASDAVPHRGVRAR